MCKYDKVYQCTRDLQGGEFAVGHCTTAQGWLSKAMEWADLDDNLGLYSEAEARLKAGGVDQDVDFVADLWDLDIDLLGEYDTELALKLLHEYTGEDTEPSLRKQAERCISKLAVNDWADTLQFFTEADLDLIKQGA